MEIYTNYLKHFVGELQEQKNILEGHCKEIHLALRRLESRKLRKELNTKEEELRKKEEFKESINLSEVDELIKKAQQVFTFDEEQVLHKGLPKKIIDKPSSVLSTYKTCQVSHKRDKRNNLSVVKHQQIDTKFGSSANQTHVRKPHDVRSSLSNKSATKPTNPVENKPKSGSVRRKTNVQDATSSATVCSRAPAKQPRSVKQPRSIKSAVRKRNVSSGTDVQSSKSLSVSGDIRHSSSTEKSSVVHDVPENVRPLSSPEKEKIVAKSPPMSQPYTDEFARVYVQARKKIKTLKSTSNKLSKENTIEMNNFLDTFQHASVKDEHASNNFDVLCQCLSQCQLTTEQFKEHIKQANDVQNIADAVIQAFSDCNGDGSDDGESGKTIFYPGKLKDTLHEHIAKTMAAFKESNMQYVETLTGELLTSQNTDKVDVQNYRLLYTLLSDWMTVPVLVVNRDAEDATYS